MDDAGRDALVPECAVRSEQAVEERELQRVGARRVLDADAGVPAVTGVGRVGAVQHVDGAVLPELHLEAHVGGRPEHLHRRVLDDEGPIRRDADRVVVDRALRIDREVLPERVDRRVRRARIGDRDGEAVVLVRPQEVQVAVVGQEDLRIGRPVELEVEGQAQPAGELIAVQRALGGRIDPVERDPPAAVPEVIELPEQAEVLDDVGVGQGDVGRRDLRAAARGCAERVRADREDQVVGAARVRDRGWHRRPERDDGRALDRTAVLGPADRARDVEARKRIEGDVEIGRRVGGDDDARRDGRRVAERRRGDGVGPGREEDRIVAVAVGDGRELPVTVVGGDASPGNRAVGGAVRDGA